jgi:hypothetical protein
MSPADLLRVVENAASAEDLERANLKVWKVGDKLEVEGVPVVLTGVVMVQDSVHPQHGRIVLFGHAVDDPSRTLNGSVPVMYPASIKRGKVSR